MDKKTSTQFRAALSALGTFAPSELDELVSQALAKGTIADDGVSDDEIARLDRAASQWDLAKASNDDEDENENEDEDEENENEDEENDDEDDEDEEDDEDDEDDEDAGSGLEEVTNAVKDGAKKAVAKALTPMRRDMRRLRAQVVAAGQMTKAAATALKSNLQKGGDRAIMDRLDALERAITGVRGDFRGIQVGDFDAIAHPGDDDGLAKGGTSFRAVSQFLLGEQAKATRVDDVSRATAIKRALASISMDTPSATLATVAANFGWKA